MKIRTHLVVLVAAAVLPVLAFAVVLTALFLQQQRQAFDQRYLEGVRAMSIALDAEINASVRTLQGLATSFDASAEKLALFTTRLERVRESQPSWASIALVDASGIEVFKSGTPGSGADRADPETLRRAITAREPAVSGVMRAESDLYKVQIMVPVERNGVVTHALVASTPQSEWLNFLTKYPIPPRSTMTLLDRNGLIIARTLNNDQWVGKQPAISLYEKSRETPDAAYRSRGLEGQWFYTAHHRNEWGWTLATGVPAEIVETALRGPLITMLAGSLLCGALAVLLAFLFGRRIARPIFALAESAKALGTGRMTRELQPAQNIEEVARVSTAFEEAQKLLMDREQALSIALLREQQAREQAETANRGKDEFLAMLGHELRNPLNAISSAMSVMNRSDAAPAATARPREVISRQVVHLTDLVDDLLDVARVNSGKIVLNSRPLNLCDAVRHSTDVMRDAGRFAQHKVEVDCQDAWVMADETRIEQIISNLLENAVKYTPSGGLVHVKVRREDNEAVFEVSDTGSGISAELLPRVFDIFTQGERTLDRAQGGLGLGLTLVRRLVDLHRGRIDAASEGAGKGATFTVRLPSIESIGRPNERPPVALKTERRMRILIVDDNDDGRDMLKMLLGLHGHEVHEAGDGPSAVDGVIAIRPDIAIVDIGLPGFDGYEVARRVRRFGNADRVMLVALTGYGQEEDRRQAQEAGFDAFLVKPVDAETLAKMLSGLR
jgi:signal transduction histidine kinase